MVSGKKGWAYVNLRACHCALTCFIIEGLDRIFYKHAFLRKQSIWPTQVGMTNESHWFEFPPVAVSDRQSYTHSGTGRTCTYRCYMIVRS